MAAAGLALAIAGAAGLGLGQGTPAAPAATTQRMQLRTAVLQALINDPVLNPYPLAATVGEDNSVTLNGRLPNSDDKDRAGKIAKAVPGVQGVHNQIQVDPTVTALALPPAGAGAAAQPAGEAGMAGTEGGSTPGSDAAVQAAVAKALHAQTALDEVSVEVRGNTVHLDGNVASAQEKAQAGAIAANLAGGRKVVNQIRVGNRSRTAA